jgi:hypothetical protein
MNTLSREIEIRKFADGKHIFLILETFEDAIPKQRRIYYQTDRAQDLAIYFEALASGIVPPEGDNSDSK